jgi:hypothetical protein
MAKPKKMYQVTCFTCTPVSVYAPSAQAACRKAFRYWIKNKELTRQPPTTDNGGFEGVTVYT